MKHGIHKSPKGIQEEVPVDVLFEAAQVLLLRMYQLKVMSHNIMVGTKHNQTISLGLSEKFIRAFEHDALIMEKKGGCKLLFTSSLPIIQGSFSSDLADYILPIGDLKVIYSQSDLPDLNLSNEQTGHLLQRLIATELYGLAQILLLFYKNNIPERDLQKAIAVANKMNALEIFTHFVYIEDKQKGKDDLEIVPNKVRLSQNADSLPEIERLDLSDESYVEVLSSPLKSIEEPSPNQNSVLRNRTKPTNDDDSNELNQSSEDSISSDEEDPSCCQLLWQYLWTRKKQENNKSEGIDNQKKHRLLVKN